MNEAPTAQTRNSRAQFVFVASTFAFSVFLLALLGVETTWVHGQPLTKQPGLWPAIALGGMVVFAAIEAMTLWRRNAPRACGNSIDVIANWLTPAEYLLWFMSYVWAVPQIGYLLATMLFCGLLTLRAGYRDTRLLIASLMIAIMIVVVFKAFLAVKIPAGAFYDQLPERLRDFMILYL